MIVTNYMYWQREFYCCMNMAKEFSESNPNLSKRFVGLANKWKDKMENATIESASELFHLIY